MDKMQFIKHYMQESKDLVDEFEIFFETYNKSAFEFFIKNNAIDYAIDKSKVEDKFDNMMKESMNSVKEIFYDKKLDLYLDAYNKKELDESSFKLKMKILGEFKENYNK